MSKRKPKRVVKPDPAAEWKARQQARTERLALYNAERARGLVHTPEWDERMAEVQARFDADLAQEAQWEADAYTRHARQRVNLEADHERRS